MYKIQLILYITPLILNLLCYLLLVLLHLGRDNYTKGSSETRTVGEILTGVFLVLVALVPLLNIFVCVVFVYILIEEIWDKSLERFARELKRGYTNLKGIFRRK